MKMNTFCLPLLGRLKSAGCVHRGGNFRLEGLESSFLCPDSGFHLCIIIIQWEIYQNQQIPMHSIFTFIIQHPKMIKSLFLQSTKCLNFTKIFFFSSRRDQVIFQVLMQRLKSQSDKSYELQSILDDSEKLQKERKRTPQMIRRQINKLSSIVSLYEELVPIIKNINDLQEMKKQQTDKEQLQFLQQQIKSLEEKKYQLKEQSIQLLIPPDLYDDVSQVNLQFRPGAGGTQSSLFIQDFSNMIISFCQGQGWSVKTVSAVQQSLLNRGYKSLTLKVRGQDVYKILKCQSGVHKVIRVPETQSKGRLHSSTISMAVMPAIPFDFTVHEKDLKYEYTTSRGPGGQSVNKTESACRVTHIPTGMSVMNQQEKSQQRNKKRATEILKERLFEIEYKKNIQNESKTRKSQVGSMDRSEKIRTYNYPQDRITDHRSKLTLFGIEQMLSGNYLQQFIKAYQEKIYQEKLESFMEELKKKSSQIN